jgi:hypothetical protein
MEMSTPKRFETRTETGQIKEHSVNPKDDTVAAKICVDEQTSPRNPAGPNVPDEGAFETFGGGAGI